MARQRADAKLTELTESLLDLSGYAALSEELRAVLPKRSEGNEVSASVAGDPVEELCDVLSIIFDLADDRLSKLTTHDTPSRYSAHITDSPASVNLSIAGDCSPFRGGDEAKGMEAKIFLRDDLATLRERVRRDAELVAEKERQLRAAEEEANEWREEIWRREEAWGNERAALAKNSQDAADEIEYDPPPPQIGSSVLFLLKLNFPSFYSLRHLRAAVSSLTEELTEAILGARSSQDSREASLKVQVKELREDLLELQADVAALE